MKPYPLVEDLRPSLRVAMPRAERLYALQGRGARGGPLRGPVVPLKKL